MRFAPAARLACADALGLDLPLDEAAARRRESAFALVALYVLAASAGLLGAVFPCAVAVYVRLGVLAAASIAAVVVLPFALASVARHAWAFLARPKRGVRRIMTLRERDAACEALALAVCEVLMLLFATGAFAAARHYAGAASWDAAVFYAVAAMAAIAVAGEALVAASCAARHDWDVRPARREPAEDDVSSTGSNDVLPL